MGDATFHYEQSLPKLPVPPLSNLQQKYLKTLRPFLNEAEEARAQQIIEDFVKKLGPQLQSRLEAYAQKQPHNWLDYWWLKYAYHSWRDPLLINSNWFINFCDYPSPAHRELLQKTRGRFERGSFTSFQVMRAAGLITNMLNYKDLIDRELLPAEKTKKGPLCMNQYRMLFGWSRVPKPGNDVLVGPCKDSRHIMVMLLNQIWFIRVYDKASGKRIRISDIEKQLKIVVGSARRRKEEVPLSILTADHRDNWANARASLESVNSDNRKWLRLIDEAIFAVALDDFSPSDSFSDQFAAMAHGFSGENRWLDKSLTLVVLPNGRAGMNGEHSPCDALIPSKLMDYMLMK